MDRLVAAEGRPGPPNFIHRVYRTTAVVSLIVALAVLGYFDWQSAASYLFGALLGIGLLWLLEHTVDAAVRRAQGSAGGVGDPAAMRARSGGLVIVGVNVLKYAVIAAGLYVLIRYGAVRVPFLLAGYGTIYLVIALKVVGRLMAPSAGEGADAASGNASCGSLRRP